MALVPCVECKHDISTEAKTCPNCGAKNRAFKSKSGYYGLTAIVFAGVLYYVFSYIPYMESITNCDTPRNRESFVGVIDDSSYAQLNKLRVIDVTNIETVKAGESRFDLVCDATIHYNSQDEKKFRFTFRESSEIGKTIVSAKLRE